MGREVAIPIAHATARQTKHWGAGTFYDVHRGYNAYLIESPEKKVLYAGDTAHFPGFRDLPAVDLAIFGIGAYNPYIAAHATPEQALEMANDCRADALPPCTIQPFACLTSPPRSLLSVCNLRWLQTPTASSSVKLASSGKKNKIDKTTEAQRPTRRSV